MEADERLREAIHLLAESDADKTRGFLGEMLDWERYPGVRCAAASALGALREISILAERLPNEHNKIVRSMIAAQLRNLTREKT